jgi:hypothetical protein
LPHQKRARRALALQPRQKSHPTAKSLLYCAVSSPLKYESAVDSRLIQGEDSGPKRGKLRLVCRALHVRAARSRELIHGCGSN